MNKTTKLGLSLYESNDKFAITASEDSLNHNMELIDEAISNISVPTKTSELTNDSGYLTTETDPTVPSWAKQSEKPTYTASEVGADPVGTASGQLSTHNTNTSAHNDIRLELQSLTNKLNAFLDSDDTTLDELSELITEIKNNQQLLSTKVNVTDIINNLTTNASNKPLSAAQGVALKALVDAIVVPTKVSELTNDSGFITGYTETDPTVPSWAKASTKPSYTKSEVGLGNVDNVQQYSASNPPPYPVTKVNNKTGAITLSASDVGADASGTASSAISAHNTSASAHADIRQQISQLSSEKVDNTDISLGVASDGLVYIFINGQPVGSGIARGSGHDVFGYVDENNVIVLSGDIANGNYTIKYELVDGSLVDIGNLELGNNTYYSIINNLTNCTSSNSAKQVLNNGTYTATITANDGYTLSSVVVTMGGVNISSTAVSGGNITIASVTDRVVITAVAEVSGPAYVNQIPLSIGTDGKPFNNGQGYKTGYRLSLSSGNESAQEGTEVTGFIPVTKDSVLRVKNIACAGDTTRGVVGYDANFAKLQTGNGVNVNALFVGNGYDDGNGVYRSQRLFSHAHFNTDDLKYIRLCSTDINANSILTVDQEIV